MRKNFKKAVVASALLATLSTQASATDSQVGVAASFNQNTSEIRGIVGLNDNLRLEPFIAFAYISPDEGDSFTNYTVGSTLEYTKELHTNIDGYIGGFGAITHFDAGDGNTNFFFGPLAGVEYEFTPNFTLGGEIRFEIGVGDLTTLSTNSSILLRYYF